MEFTTESLGDGIVVIRGDGRLNMVSGPALRNIVKRRIVSPSTQVAMVLTLSNVDPQPLEVVVVPRLVRTQPHARKRFRFTRGARPAHPHVFALSDDAEARKRADQPAGGCAGGVGVNRKMRRVRPDARS